MKDAISSRSSAGAPLDYGFLGDDISAHLWRVNWATLGYSYVGVYCIAPDNRWPTKVGHSEKVGNRLTALQVSHWRQLDVFGYAYCENAIDACAVERKTHALLKEDGGHLNGEWFNVRPDKAFETVKFAANVLGVQLRTDVPDEKVHGAIYKALSKLISDEMKARAGKDWRRLSKPATPSFSPIPYVVYTDKRATNKR